MYTSNDMASPHFFIDVSLYKDTTGGKVMFRGQKAIKSQNKDAVSVINEINDLRPKKIILYVHGFMGHVSSFYTTTTPILQNEIFSHLGPDVVVLSINWFISAFYRTAHEKLPYLIDKLAELLSKLTLQDVDLQVLGHSMGCLVTHHTLQKNNLHYRSLQCIYAAPDIPISLFKNDAAKYIQTNVQCHVLYHLRDRTLIIANIIQPYQRLGLYGADVDHANINNIEIVNLDDNKGITPRIFLHRYYYASPSVRDLILSILLEGI
jgi:esterase/lipase superfamily enzyme